MNSKLMIVLPTIILITIAITIITQIPPTATKLTKKEEALISVKVMQKAIVAIVDDIEAFPKDTYGLEVIYTNVHEDDKWDGPYYLRRTYTKDPWGNEIIYKYPHNCKARVGSFALYSVGKNGMDECMSGDDIFIKL